MSQALAGIDRGSSETLSSVRTQNLINNLNKAPFVAERLCLVTTQIRSKLQQLMDSVWITHAMLAEQGNAALLPWPDILSRYTLLLSHTHAIINQLVQPPYGDEASPAWNKTLATSAFVPVVSVDSQKEAMVNGFLSPNQPPYVLEEAARLIETLPAGLQVPRPPPQTDLDEEVTPEQQSQYEKIQDAVNKHETMLSEAFKHVKKLRAGAMADDDEEDEQDGFHGGMEIDEFGMEQEDEIPPYVWNSRLAEDDDDGQGHGAENDGDEDVLFGSSATAPSKPPAPSVNLVDVASFLRDGRKGKSFYR